MKWKVDQNRGSWTATVVLIAARNFEYLRDTQIPVVLDDNINWKTQTLYVDGDWWKTGRFNELLKDDAIILVRKHLGFDDNGSSIVGHKIGLFRIGNVRKDGDVLSFSLVDRLKGAIE